MTVGLTRPPQPPQKFVDPNGQLSREALHWFHDLLQILDAAEINVTTTVTQLFEPTTLTTVAATLYTAPLALTSPGTVTLRKGRVRFTNVDGSAHTVTAYAVPVGGTAGNTTNAFMVAESIAANSHVDVDLPMLGAGDFFQALASANSVVVCSALDGAVYT